MRRSAIGMGASSPPRRALGVDRAVGRPDASGPDLGPSVDGLELKPYQVEGIRWLRDRKSALLADQMGLGKSVQTLRSLKKRSRTVVVCPASVSLEWRRETARWRPDLSVTTGEPLRRPHEGEVLVVSCDSLPDPPRGGARTLLPEMCMSDVDLVADEVQMFKNASAQRTQKFRMLRQQCARCWGLSGTPMVGVPEDLWGVLVSLGLEHIYGNWSDFVALYNGQERWIFDKRTRMRRRAGYIWGDVSPRVHEILQTVMLRRRRSDVLKDLPPSQYVDVPVPAPEDLTSFLDEVKGEWDDVGPGDLPPFELLSEAMAALARSKIDAAVEWTERAAAEFPLLVFSAHRDPVIEVGTRVKGAGYFVGDTPVSERGRLVEEFKAGRLRVLAMTIDTGGAGLNLQEAGGVLFVDRDYTPGANAQAEARANRPGQKHESVLVARLISEHPLDKRLSEILDEKSRLISAAVG